MPDLVEDSTVGSWQERFCSTGSLLPASFAACIGMVAAAVGGDDRGEFAAARPDLRELDCAVDSREKVPDLNSLSLFTACIVVTAGVNQDA